MSYAQKLSEMGIVASRIEDITTAMDSLHKALSKLDNSQLSMFSNNFGLIGHLDLYAREEQLRNIANDMYMSKLRKSIRNIDFDEFTDFSDKLSYLAEEASELGIPGAHQLCKSLKDITSVMLTPKLPLARLAKKIHNIAKVAGDSYQYTHLYDSDDNCVGKMYTIYGVDRKNDNNDSGTTLIFVCVDLDDMQITTKEIKQGLMKALHSGRCSHDFCGCGCIQEYPIGMKLISVSRFTDIQTWAVKMSWHRNV